MEYAVLIVFIPTIMLVSSTPGLCMTLAFSLGLRYGFRRTLWMMAGELMGVGLVATTALVGVASIMLNYPSLFIVLKVLGSLYLFHVAYQMWQTSANFHAQNLDAVITPKKLIIQGFITAISNPKGWAFTVSLLPGFINRELPMTPQVISIVLIMLMSELLFMCIYATGGKKPSQFLTSENHLHRLNQGVAILIGSVGLWLLFGH